MDLSFFLDKENSEIVGDIRDAIGIYIVSQKELPKQYENVTRNGAAGTKEVIDARNQSSFKSRMGMYLKGRGRARDWFDRNATLSALVSI